MGRAIRFYFSKMKNILVVDDDPVVRVLMSELVKIELHNALEAENAEAALRLLQKPVTIDFLVTDIRMPGLNGYELAKIVRAKQPDIPILLVSGFGEVRNNIPPDFFEDVKVDFLSKPFDIRTFIRRINSTLNYMRWV